MYKLPSLVFAIVFIVVLALTQLLTYQQYELSKDKHKSELIQEAGATKDRFKNILFNDIAAASTLAIIYKQYGVPASFDSVASQIINNSRYAQALQITENGIVKNAYPDTHYKGTIGTNVNTDPVRKAEEARAFGRKDIYFAGPRRLRFGDTGILGKVPVIINNHVVAVATVLTRLNIIKKELEHAGIDKKKFAYQLVKFEQGRHVPFPMSDTKPAQESEHIYSKIPEGDWLLRVSYTDDYALVKFPFILSGMGILLSFVAGLLAYRKVQEPYKLKKIIEEKTDQLAKSERYFRTLIETSSDAIVLMDIAGKVLYQTSSAEKILGYTLSEIQEIDGIELIHPGDRAKDNTMFTQLVSNPGNIIHQNHRIKHKNGNYVHIDGTYRNLLYDENVKAIVYSYKDITDKVLSEQQLAYYNRELTLLNQINDIILRVGDELQLYEEVCECIITAGNYPLAWICHKPDAGATDQTVVPLVAKGATEYLSGAKIVLDDPELSNGPTAIALLTGKTVINNDIANSTYFGQFVKNANRFGIYSSAALHLNLGGDKSGALIIYAGQASAFDETEVSTLNRLAANLSIAVQNIKNRLELAESESRFRGAFEDSAIGMGLTSLAENSTGQWIKVNRSLCDMLGYTEDELLSLTFMQITHPDDLARDLAAQDETLMGGSGTYRLEKRYIHKNGSIVWINLNVSVINDKDKRPLYLVAQIENITEKIESQFKFQNLVENFIVGVYIIQDEKMVYVNPRMAEEMGYTEDEIINQSFEKFIYKDDIKLVRENIKEREEKGIRSTSRYEARIVKKDGQPLWFEVLGGLTLYRGQPALLGTVVNITERKSIYDKLEVLNQNLVQQAGELAVSNADLEQSQKMYSDLFNFSPLPAWVTEMETLRFLDINNEAVLHYGYSRDEFLSMTLKDIRLPEDLPAMERAVADRVKQKDGVFRTTMTHKKKNGELINMDIQVAPISYSGLPANIAIATDITERQNYINAIEEQNTRLLEISWIQSHIVRAPLSRMLGLIPMLEDSVDVTEESKMILDYLLTSAYELDEVIKTVTDKSKIEDFQSLRSDIKGE